MLDEKRDQTLLVLASDLQQAGLHVRAVGDRVLVAHAHVVEMVSAFSIVGPAGRGILDLYWNNDFGW